MSPCHGPAARHHGTVFMRNRVGNEVRAGERIGNPAQLFVVQITMNKRGDLIAVACAVALAGVVSIGALYPAIWAARRAPRPMNSETNMHALTQGLLLYAENNRHRFPPVSRWPDALVKSGIIEEAILESPAEDGDGVSFIYLSGLATMDTNQILIYEDPKHFEDGVLVGFADGRVKMVPHVEFNRRLAEQTAKSP